MNIADLTHYHENPRQGDVEAIIESIRELGQFRTIVVNRGTGTGIRNEVLAGNHVLMAMRALGKTEVEVDYVDVDAETAAKIVLIDNRAGDLATYDSDALAGLIESVGRLEGTGYTAPTDAGRVTEAKSVGEAPKQAKPSGGQGHDQYDDYEAYRESGTRHLFLEWPVVEYEAVYEDLEHLRKRWALPTTGDVVKALIR